MTGMPETTNESGRPPPAEDRRPGEGHRRDALRRRPRPARPAARAHRARHPCPRAHRRHRPSAALDVPGVVAVLTASDLPVVGSGPQRRFEPLAIDEIVYAGQPVALVVARTEEAAEDGAALVRVDEEPLTPVVDLLGALDPPRRSCGSTSARAPSRGRPSTRTIRWPSRSPGTSSDGPTTSAATWMRSWPSATSSSRARSTLPGRTRPTWSHTRRPRGSSPTGRWPSPPARRRCSRPGTTSRRSSGCRWRRFR